MFWSIAIRLVSQTPDNLVYHLFILLTLGVILGLAWWQQRRIPQDDFAWRLIIGTAGIFVTRLILPLSNSATPAPLLAQTTPPLERALDTALVCFLVWLLLPPIKSLPRLNDALLLLSLFVVGLSYRFANDAWQTQFSADLAYTDTSQAALWSATQLTLIIAALLLIAATRPPDWGSRLMVLLPITIATALHLPNYLPDSVNFAILAPNIAQGYIPFWNRLAYLIAFPLLAAVTQRHILRDLIIGRFGDGSILSSLPATLEKAGTILLPLTAEDRAAQAAEIIAEFIPAQFTAITQITSQNPQGPIAIYQPSASQPHKKWTISLAAWAGLQTAVNNQEIVELLPNGLGARQLYGLSQELNLGEMGPILIVPLINPQHETTGLLLMGTDPSRDSWDSAYYPAISALARYIAIALEQVVKPA